MIAAQTLIEKFRQSLDEGWGYIYGATHEMWSSEKQKEYERKYADDTDRQNSCKYGGKWAGHWVTDCSGLFHYWFSQLGGRIAHGSNTIWDDYCSAKGELSRGERTDGKVLQPGTAVFTSSGTRHNHIGLYVGDGLVIEAQGAQAGVTTTQITNKRWTHWGELSGVRYGGDVSPDGGKQEEKAMEAKVMLPPGAEGSSVNMRKEPQKGAALVERVPVGAVVEVLAENGDWCRIQYRGKTGWMMSTYLDREKQDGGESGGGGDPIPDGDRAAIESALKKMEEQIEVIRSALGRG